MFILTLKDVIGLIFLGLFALFWIGLGLCILGSTVIHKIKNKFKK